MRSFIVAVLLASAVINTGAAETRHVEVGFDKSVYSDYLFYLLYRNGGAHEETLKKAVPLDGIEELDQLISLPQTVLEARTYKDVYRLAEPYRNAKQRVERMPTQAGDQAVRFRRLSHSEKLPDFEKLQRTLTAGEASFNAFRQVWERDIAPAEDRQIDAWREQEKACRPLDRLQQLARMRFPFDRLKVAAVALHLAGSANTDPPAITTQVWKKPDLAWVIGHEGTHLLVDEYAGARWPTHRGATELIAQVVATGGEQGDIEEALSLLMQVKLSQSCGWTDKNYSLAAKLKDDGSAKYKIIVGLERDWDAYQNAPQKNLVDFLIESAGRSLGKQVIL